MTVQTIDTDQISSLQEHIDKATALEPARIAEIRVFTAQLLEQELPVLPIVGAGASYDCGMRLANALGEDLYRDYMNNPDYASEPRDAVKKDLADVAQAIHNAAGQVAVVKAIGLDDPTLWPDAEKLPEHFCLYRVLSRLARESLFAEVIGFNYDCAKEAGLKREGFQLSPNTIAGRKWSDHATVIADKQTMYKPPRKGALTYHKAHGCAHRVRELALTDEAKAAETIIVCSEQLTNWRNDLWMAERLRDRARESLLVLIGFSAQDAAVHGELKRVLDEIYQELPAEGKPRLVTIDAKPETPVLRGLVKSGLGGELPLPGVVTEINVSTSSTTAVALVLLTEYLRLILAYQLEVGDYTLPDGLDEQIAALVIAAPLMLRWTYLLRVPAKDQYVQTINMEQAAHGGYVPFTVDPRGAVLALETRVKLREALSIVGPESTRETLTDHGFITRAGFAYLPVALTLEELLAACQPGGTIERARGTLGAPSKIERILVTLQDDVLQGVNADTGAEVVVPA
jgi:hypothetical protein